MSYNNFNLSEDKNISELQDTTLELSSAPTQSIVSLEEARNYLKTDSDITADDDLINSLIRTATSIVEKRLGDFSLYHQSHIQKQQGGTQQLNLLRTPVIGTPTVSYYSSFDTVTATNITASTHFKVVGDKLIHKDGYFKRGRDGDGYVIEYDTGLFTASNYTSSDDPRLQTFKEAILRLIARMSEQREEGTTVIHEGNWSITYDDKAMLELKNLIMPFHTGRGIL